MNAATNYIAKATTAQEFSDWINSTTTNRIVPMFLKKNKEYGLKDSEVIDVLATVKQIGARNFPGLYSKHPYLAMVKGLGILEDKHLVALSMDPTTSDYLGKAIDCVIYSLFRLFLLEQHKQACLPKTSYEPSTTGTMSIDGVTYDASGASKDIRGNEK